MIDELLFERVRNGKERKKEESKNSLPCEREREMQSTDGFINQQKEEENNNKNSNVEEKSCDECLVTNMDAHFFFLLY